MKSTPFACGACPMRTSSKARLLTVISLLAALPLSSVAAPTDSRNIVTGFPIPKEGYCDQPYVVVTRDGNWLCLLTTGPGTRIAEVPARGGGHQCRPWQELVETHPHRAGPCAGLAHGLAGGPVGPPPAAASMRSTTTMATRVKTPAQRPAGPPVPARLVLLPLLGR